jgi:hypothetical protein
MIASKEYDAQMSHARVAMHAFHASASADTLAATMQSHGLRLYVGSGQPVPEGAGHYFTVPQRADILAGSKLRSFGDRTCVADLQYIFKIYKAFYPDITFFMDWDNPNPDAYAFSAYGEKFVVVAGGLVRVGGLTFKGLATIVGGCVGRFIDPGPPATKLDSGLLPTVQADYYGVGLVMRTAWYENFFDICDGGIKEIEALFTAAAADGGGNSDNPLEEPSLDCRKETMMNAWLGGALPPCAGGPQPPTDLRLQGAQIAPVDGTATPVLYFNHPVDPTSAGDVANYAVKPSVALTSATVQSDDQTGVALAGPYVAGTAYMVIVSNLTDSSGNPLDPNYDVVRFVMPKAAQ